MRVLLIALLAAISYAQTDAYVNYVTCSWVELETYMIGAGKQLPHIGYECDDGKVMVGMETNEDKDPIRIRCCNLVGHSHVLQDSCRYQPDVEKNEQKHNHVSCDEDEALVGLYHATMPDAMQDQRGFESLERGRCCKVLCEAEYCPMGKFGIDEMNCKITRVNKGDNECSRNQILKRVIDDTDDGKKGLLHVTAMECCGLDQVAPPSVMPTKQPTEMPSEMPTFAPTTQPTNAPSFAPTSAPTENPTKAPTPPPTEHPTLQPTSKPSESPTESPTWAPTTSPSSNPTLMPTQSPTTVPSEKPTIKPTTSPTTGPTHSPTKIPSFAPTPMPTENPSEEPTTSPTTGPTPKPTEAPSELPSDMPSDEPTEQPTFSPSDSPSAENDETTKAVVPQWYPSDNFGWSLFPGSEVCVSGMEQSPIDLPALFRAKHRTLIDPIFNPIQAMVKDTGHGLKWELEAGEGETILDDPKLFNALQFHIHTGAEHTVTGIRSDIEFHFVHQAEDGAYGVLGIMCNAGDSDLLFWNQLETSLTEETTIDAESLFESVDMTKYFTYDGSFTTPPCTEGVKWIVIADMCTIPTDLLEKFSAYESMKRNYRHRQALNGRKIGGTYSLTDIVVEDEDIGLMYDEIAFDLDYDYYPIMEDTSGSISKTTHHLASPAVLIIIFLTFAFLFCTFQAYNVYKKRSESEGNIQANGLTAPLIDEDFSISDIKAESPDPLSQI